MGIKRGTPTLFKEPGIKEGEKWFWILKWHMTYYVQRYVHKSKGRQLFIVFLHLLCWSENFSTPPCNNRYTHTLIIANAFFFCINSSENRPTRICAFMPEPFIQIHYCRFCLINLHEFFFQIMLTHRGFSLKIHTRGFLCRFLWTAMSSMGVRCRKMWQKI